MLQPAGWKDVVRCAALAFFVLAHMQDVEPKLCPLSVALVACAYLPDLVWYKRLPTAFLPAIAFPIYITALLFIHGNFSDGSAKELFLKDGRIIYTAAVFVAFAHLRPTARFEPLFFRATLLTVAVLSTFCLFSYFVKPLKVGTAQLAQKNAVVTGLLGANTQNTTGGKSAAEVATTNSKNAMAFALGAVLAFAAAAWLHQYRRERPECFDRITPWLLAPIVPAFLLAKSRGCDLALGGVLAVVSFVVLRRNARWLGMIVTGAALVGLMFLASNATRDQSHMNRNVGHRFTQWQKGLVLLARSPVIGVGVGAFQQVDRRLETLVPYLLAVRSSGRSFSGRQLVEGDETGPGSPIYNSYLKVVLDFGLAGLAIYAAWYWNAFQRGREVLRFSTTLRPDLEILRQHATYNATVVGLSLVFICMQSMTESQCLIGPSGHVIYAAAFGRLVAQSELLRSLDRPLLQDAATG